LQKVRSMHSFKNRIPYYLMLIPGFAWLIMFNILPMSGVLIAFEDFNPKLGLLDSEWIGFSTFEYMFSLRDVRTVVFNTFYIAVVKIILGLIVPLVFALLMNEVKKLRFKKIVQTIVYLPHFISWVILASIVTNMFGNDGIVNQIVVLLGGERKIFMSDAGLFRWLIILSDTWKEFGYGAVIYFAALAGIDPTLYEAASIDGAGHWKQVIHITIPSISSTIVLLTALSLGNVLNAGFDQVFNMYNPLVYSTSDIIDTWVYRIGLTKLQYSLATAVGLFKSVVSLALIVASQYLAKRLTDYSIF